MSHSRQTDPYPVRAERRAAPAVPVRECRPRPGFHHPAGAADVLQVLDDMGPVASYGLGGVELRQAPPHANLRHHFGALHPPGRIVLYEQPDPPWRVPGQVSGRDRIAFERAGAVPTVTAGGTEIDWPDRSLRTFMLADVLLHEIGHHVTRHRRGKRTVPRHRTTDDERLADEFSAAWRDRLRALP